MSMYAVAVGVADIRRDPDPASELVTQALMNAPANAGETSGEWTHVTLSDYAGWIRSDQLEEPAPWLRSPGESLVAIITATHTPLFMHQQGEETLGLVYLSTALPLLDTTAEQRAQVALPGGRSAWLAHSSIRVGSQEEPFPRQPVAAVTSYARAFLGTPYLWGGTSYEGLDCSGFVQLCYRMGGYRIPRDAHQQHDFLSHSVERGAMREGDLLFFGSRSITHVALALNNHEYIHAEGQNYHRVLINSFDKRDPHYYPRLDEIFWGAKRVGESNAGISV
jgi:gamma-D-glutamyl-L-lysine dipeptidyl-peptidase